MSPDVIKEKPRARDIGIVIGPLLHPGPKNAITDVPRIRVGMTEKIVEPKAVPGEKKEGYLIRAGITLITADNLAREPLFAGIDALQPAGELTGTNFIESSGRLHTPIALTGLPNIGSVYHAIHKAETHGWLDSEAISTLIPISLPVVGETYDRMSDPRGMVDGLGEDDLKRAIADLKANDSGIVREGNAGGGTPMVSFGMKGGTGTSSRVIPAADGSTFTVGVLVQANHGSPIDLTIAGVPVGKVLYEEGYMKPWYPNPPQETRSVRKEAKDGDGSIIVVIATDAPLLPFQCKAVARRAALGVGRGGGGVNFFSGDIFICVSTATPLTPPQPPKYADIIEPVSTYTIKTIHPECVNVIYRAAADATEEAILNALFAAEELDGYTGQRWRKLPVERVREILKEYGRVV